MSRSEILFNRALKIIPGGVNSPVRAFKGIGTSPVFFHKGEGAIITDVDKNNYIDYVCSWGAIILGHSHPDVILAISQVLKEGISFGAPHPLEIKLAEKIINLVPAIEKLRMVNSGTEATMTAIRLARGYTGKKMLIKFNGCYHGHSDSLLVNAGSGVLTLGIPQCPGVPDEIAQNTLTAEFNDIDSIESLFAKHSDEIAAVIIEPIAGNMGMILPDESFLKALRALCDKYQAVLIFDEVMTGFRVSLQGAGQYYNIEPDLVTLGKVIGAGLPVGALGGKTQIMDCLAPNGQVYQAGTLSGNPVVMAAGLKVLEKIEQPNFYANLSKLTNHLTNGMKDVANSLKIPFNTVSLGGMFGFCFNEKESIKNYKDIRQSDLTLFKSFYQGMLLEGVYLAPSMFEAGFISSMHTIELIDTTIEKAEKVLSNLKNNKKSKNYAELSG